KMDNLDLIDTVAAKLAEFNAERKALEAELHEAQRDANNPVAEAWGEVRSLLSLLKRDNSDEMRLRVRSALRSTIEAIHCVFVKQGATSFAAIEVHFARNGGERSYIVIARRQVTLGKIRRPGRWWSGSVKHPGSVPFNRFNLAKSDPGDEVCGDVYGGAENV